MLEIFDPDQETEQILCDVPEYMFNNVMELSDEFTKRKVKGRENRREMLEVILQWWFKYNQYQKEKPVQWECDIPANMSYELRSTLNIQRPKQNAAVSHIIQHWYLTEYHSTVQKIPIIKAEKEVEEAHRVLTDALDNLSMLKGVQVPQVNPSASILPIEEPKKYHKKKTGPQYTVLKPDGTYEDVENLTEFCENHGIHYNSLSKRLYIQPRTGKKIMSPTHGYYVWKINDPEIEIHKAGKLIFRKAKTSGGGAPKSSYRITWADSSEEIVVGMNIFRNEHGFSVRRIAKMKADTDKEGIKINKIEV